MSSGGRRCAVPQSGQAKSVVPFSTSSVSPQPAQRTSTASGGGVAIGWEKGKEVSLGFLGTLSLSALMTFIFILYTSCSAKFSPLYSILPYPSILYIILYSLYLLWDLLVTLSKYIHV
jgi:hypothetical protein